MRRIPFPEIESETFDGRGVRFDHWPQHSKKKISEIAETPTKHRRAISIVGSLGGKDLILLTAVAC